MEPQPEIAQEAVMSRSTLVVVLLTGAPFLAGLALAESRPVPTQAEVATRARAALVLFSDSVQAGDSGRFVATFTPEFRAVFTPDRWKSLASQFYDKKLALPEARTAPLRFLRPAAFGTAGSLEAKGFFEVSWRVSGATWTMDGFGAKAFPKPGLPTNSQLDELLDLVVAFNAALESGSFGTIHAMLAKDVQQSMTPEQMQKNFEKFTRDKQYARSLTKNQVLFAEIPDVIGEAYLILKTHVPLASGNLKVTLMCVKQGRDWKAKDLRAWIE
jgi:hypothetical protein